MSDILHQVKSRLSESVLNQDKASRTTLRTVVGEVQTRSLRAQSEITDALVIKVLKDTIAGNRDTLKYRENPGLEKENELLSSFLPAMMTEEQVRQAIVDSGAQDMPMAMKYLSKNHAGLFDGKSAKAIAVAMFN